MGVNRFHLALLIAVAVLVAACAPAPSSSVQFPIIGSDPDGLVETMEWLVDAPDAPAPDDYDEPLVLEASSSTAVVIAVKGGGCPPSAQVSVMGPVDDVEVAMNLGGTIEPPGVDCAAVVSTHVMVIRFKEPIDLDSLAVSAVRTGVSGG